MEGSAQHYQLEAWVPDTRALKSLTFESPIPPEIEAAYLQLPESLPPRVSAFAEKLVSGTDTPLEAALTIQDYLREAVPYDVNTPPPPAGADAVDYFLFDAPSGFCTYYASTMAVLLRTQGIPARLVTGFAKGELDYQTQIYRVPASNAHAWVEVYFAGYGWVPFEPTPSQAAAVYDIGKDEEVEAARVITKEQWLFRRKLLRGLVITLSLLVVALIAFFGWRLWQKRKDHVHRGTHPAVKRYQELLFRLSLAGFSQPGARTPREYLIDNQTLADRHPRLWAALEKTTAVYEQAVFSPRQPTQPEMAIVRQFVRQSIFAWLGLYIAHLWKRMSRRKSAKLNSKTY